MQYAYLCNCKWYRIMAQMMMTTTMMIVTRTGPSNALVVVSDLVHGYRRMGWPSMHN